MKIYYTEAIFLCVFLITFMLFVDTNQFKHAKMVDHGWPLTTEPNALTDLIRPPTVMAKVSRMACGFAYQVF